MRKVWKGISLFVVYPLLFMGLGIYVGVKASHFFYPGEQSGRNIWGQNPGAGLQGLAGESLWEQNPGGEDGSLGQGQSEADGFLAEGMAGEEGFAGQGVSGEGSRNPGALGDGQGLGAQETGNPGQEGFGGQSAGNGAQGSGYDTDSVEASAADMTLCVDTEYVLEETDLLNHTVVETSWRLPQMYVGMNREQFLKSMETYESSPPLSELERGFVGLEVLSFSRERVVVQKNYRFVQPSASFYLAVYDNEVVVYLEDKQTVYIETQIGLDSLPEELQQEIIEMKWIEDEEKLYNFLENYSS